MTAEDPRELARRLAEEAKRRLREVPPPVDEPLDELFDERNGSAHPALRAAEPAPSRPPADHARGGPPDDGYEDGPDRYAPDDDDGASLSSQMVTRPLSERAAGGGTRPMSALEALAAAREAEKQRAAVSRPPPPNRREPLRGVAERPTHSAAPTPKPEARQEAARPAVGGKAPLALVEAIVRDQYPGADVGPGVPVASAEVFRALWRVHRARAQHEGDVMLVATAGVLLDANRPGARGMARRLPRLHPLPPPPGGAVGGVGGPRAEGGPRGGAPGRHLSRRRLTAANLAGG